MTNVYTRRNKQPRTVTLMDFNTRELPPVRKEQLRLNSPSRRGNPHPLGLKRQLIPSQKTFLIWHPDFRKRNMRAKGSLKHTKKVNFTCLCPSETELTQKVGKIPVINYTVNTESRCSYKNPSRFPELVNKSMSDGFSFSNRLAARGIVPNLTVKEYLPVISH